MRATASIPASAAVTGSPASKAGLAFRIGLWGDDLPKAVEWMTAHGVRFAPGGIRKGAAGFDVTFIHPALGLAWHH